MDELFNEKQVAGKGIGASACPECGQSFEGEFSLSYHRKLAHGLTQTAIDVHTDTDSLRKVKMAVIAGIITAAVTTVFELLNLFGTEGWALLDAVALLFLTLGVQMKNRACAVLLLLLWIGEKLTQFIEYPDTLIGLPIAILFGYWFYQGMVGTFALRRKSTGP